MNSVDGNDLETNFYYYIKPRTSEISTVSFRGKFAKLEENHYVFENVETKISCKGYLGWMKKANTISILKTDDIYAYYEWKDHPENKELKLKRKPFMHMASKGKDNWWIGNKSHA